MTPFWMEDAEQARREVGAKGLRGRRLVERLRAVAPADRDSWLDVVLGLPEVPPDVANLPRGAVPYLPAGVDEVLVALAELPVRVGDTFVDLGSGLGRVVMLAHLISGAAARGIELQAPLVEEARRCAAALGLDAVSFEHADATTAALQGSVFFLYAPFNGPMLATVMGRLRALSATQQVRLCTVDLELSGERWLRARPSSNEAVTLYDSRG